MAVSAAKLSEIVNANEERLSRDPFFLAKCLEAVSKSGKLAIVTVGEDGTEYPAEAMAVVYHAGGDGEVSIAVGTRKGMAKRAEANNNAILYRDFFSLPVPE